MNDNGKKNRFIILIDLFSNNEELLIVMIKWGQNERM